MSKNFNDAFKAVETLKEFGFNMETILSVLDKKNEEAKQEMVLADLQKKIANIFTGVEGDHTFVVRKNGNTVKVSIAKNIRNEVANVTAPASSVEHIERPCKKKDIKRGPWGTMSVTVNGKVFMCNNGAETMQAVIEYIGVNKVKSVVVKNGLVANKVPLISNTLDKKYASTQHKLSTGEYLSTHGGLQWKKDMIEKIGSFLPEYDIKVEIA